MVLTCVANETITKIKLINISIPLYRYHFFVMRKLKIYSFSKCEVYSIWYYLTIVTIVH